MVSQDLALKVTFETTLAPSVGPDKRYYPYDLENVPHLNAAMVKKIEENIALFGGSAEKFLEQFQKELTAKFDAADNAVRNYHVRKLQMDFVINWMAKNVTKSDPALDA